VAKLVPVARLLSTAASSLGSNPGISQKYLQNGMGKKQDPEPGSRTNNPDHISESLEIIFWVKVLKLFYADPG
jgi:hypothetical protein